MIDAGPAGIARNPSRPASLKKKGEGIAALANPFICQHGLRPLVPDRRPLPTSIVELAARPGDLAGDPRPSLLRTLPRSTVLYLVPLALTGCCDPSHSLRNFRIAGETVLPALS